LLLAWIVAARLAGPFLVPSPGAVWRSFLAAWRNGTYWPAVATTVEESFWGWFVALAIAVPLGYTLGRLRLLERVLAPYLAGSQAMPIVAIAPLLVVWVGVGLLQKVIVCALISFFPILATTATGIRSVPPELKDAARVAGAGEPEVARYVEFPLAARTIFTGVKVAAALSVTGAVVGEFVAASQGLGFLLLYANNQFDTPLIFVALLSLIALGALAYFLVGLAEAAVLRWDD